MLGYLQNRTISQVEDPKLMLQNLLMLCFHTILTSICLWFVYPGVARNMNMNLRSFLKNSNFSAKILSPNG